MAEGRWDHTAWICFWTAKSMGLKPEHGELKLSIFHPFQQGPGRTEPDIKLGPKESLDLLARIYAGK